MIVDALDSSGNEWLCSLISLIRWSYIAALMRRLPTFHFQRLESATPSRKRRLFNIPTLDFMLDTADAVY